MRHTVHGINTDLLTMHTKANESAILDIGCKITDFIEFSEDDYYQHRVKEKTTDRWHDTDVYLDEIVEAVIQHGTIPDVWNPYGRSELIIAVPNADGDRWDYDKLSESSKEYAHKYESDWLLSSVDNVPPEILEAAREQWLEDQLSRMPIYTASVFASYEIEASFLRFSAEISGDVTYEEIHYADGRVQIVFSASGSIGAGINGKVVEVEAGVEAGALLMHEFQNEQDATAFIRKLESEILSADIVGAVSTLADSSTVKSLVVSGGVYAEVEAEAGIPQWLETDANVSVHFGVGRDFIKDENILYFGGAANLKMEFGGLSTIDVETAVEVSFEGEMRSNSDGDRYVDFQCTVGASAGIDIDYLQGMLPGLEVGTGMSTGVEVALNARLYLDDPSAVQAWENLLNPLDGSIDIAEFLDRASVRAQVSSVAEAEGPINVDLSVDAGIASASVKVESGVEVKVVEEVWLKAPDEGFQKVDL